MAAASARSAECSTALASIRPYGWSRPAATARAPRRFGLGFERLVVYLCGLGNIRDAIPYPRVPNWASF